MIKQVIIFGMPGGSEQLNNFQPFDRRAAMIQEIREEAQACGEVAMAMEAGVVGMNFQEWMASVDAIFDERFGSTSEDLPDYIYYDLWEDGATSLEVACDMEEILVG